MSLFASNTFRVTNVPGLKEIGDLCLGENYLTATSLVLHSIHTLMLLP